MKSILAAVACTVALAGPAGGQSLNNPWSGFYAGVLGGFGENSTISAAGTVTSEFSGAIAGGFAGYRFDAGSLVVGGEIDVTYKGGTVERPAMGEHYHLGWGGSAKVTIGYPSGAFLPYLAAGVAVTEATATIPGFNGRATHLGFSAAAGLEFAATENISTRIQYRYTDFGLANYGAWFGMPMYLQAKSHSIEVGAALQF